MEEPHLSTSASLRLCVKIALALAKVGFGNPASIPLPAPAAAPNTSSYFRNVTRRPLKEPNANSHNCS